MVAKTGGGGVGGCWSQGRGREGEDKVISYKITLFLSYFAILLTNVLVIFGIFFYQIPLIHLLPKLMNLPLILIPHLDVKA